MEKTEKYQDLQISAWQPTVYNKYYDVILNNCLQWLLFY